MSGKMRKCQIRSLKLFKDKWTKVTIGFPPFFGSNFRHYYYLITTTSINILYNIKNIVLLWQKQDNIFLQKDSETDRWNRHFGICDPPNFFCECNTNHFFFAMHQSRSSPSIPKTTTKNDPVGRSLIGSQF